MTQFNLQQLLIVLNQSFNINTFTSFEQIVNKFILCQYFELSNSMSANVSFISNSSAFLTDNKIRIQKSTPTFSKVVINICLVQSSEWYWNVLAVECSCLTWSSPCLIGRLLRENFQNQLVVQSCGRSSSSMFESVGPHVSFACDAKLKYANGSRYTIKSPSISHRHSDTPIHPSIRCEYILYKSTHLT